MKLKEMEELYVSDIAYHIILSKKIKDTYNAWYLPLRHESMTLEDHRKCTKGLIAILKECSKVEQLLMGIDIDDNI